MAQERGLTWKSFGLPVDPFPEVSGQIEFGGIGCENPLAFACYNPEMMIMGKEMREHLPFCGAAWHGKENQLNDMFGSGTSLPILPNAGGESFESYEIRLRAFFYMLYLLRIEFWAWHDYDLVPKGDNLTEFHSNIDKMVPVILELQKTSGVKCGWTTQNLFSFPIYCEGAATSPFGSAFVLAAAQTKKMLEVGKIIGACNHVFWGGREGYNQLLTTVMNEERRHMATFLHMAVDYAEEIGFEAQFLIEPKPMEPTAHQYDANAEICLGFLREFGLIDYFKLNLEVNHAELAGLPMLHECIVAVAAGKLGGIDANEGTFGNGWDTDEFIGDPLKAFGIMYAVLRAGGLDKGVINFDAKRRRGSFAPIDHFYAHILGMDTMAIGLRTAALVIQEKLLSHEIISRYSRSGDRVIGNDEPDFIKLAVKGYKVPYGVTAEKSSHHEKIRSIVLRAMIRATR